MVDSTKLPEVDINAIATDLNGKADTDLTNVTNSAKVMMSGMAMPSDKYIDLTLGASGSTYTAPANGWYYFRGTVSDISGGYVALYYPNSPYLGMKGMADVKNGLANAYIPVTKGQTVMTTYNKTTSPYMFRFIYAVGSESEAS